MSDLTPPQTASQSSDETAQLRRWMYTLLIAVAVGAGIGRILNAERVYEPTMYADPTDPEDKRGTWPDTRPPSYPTFSSNDRSRWATIRTLIDHGTFVIGEREVFSEEKAEEVGEKWREKNTWHEDWPKDKDGKYAGFDNGWDTVDKVLHPKTHKFYSTKPPLLTTLLAGLYWLLQLITQWTLADNVWLVVRTMLILVNVLPFALYLGLLAVLVERYCENNWSRLVIMTMATFGTLVTPFLVTLNNHTMATFSILFALYPVMPILFRQDAQENQTPGIMPFLISGLFAAFAACNEAPAAAFTAVLGLLLLWRYPLQTLIFYLPATLLIAAAFFLTNYLAIGEWTPVQWRFGNEWYMFEGSHWAKPPELQNGIDFASKKKYGETHLIYAFHVFLGHHGIFSLTPIWLLAFVGMGVGAAKKTGSRLSWLFFAMAALLSVVVISFYLTVSSRNYGGYTCGLRWLMWLTPLWLLSLIPVLNGLSKTNWGKWVTYVFLTASVLSVAYPAWNPWRHPWLLRWMQDMGWVLY